jgi:sarcosine oxidase subunit beta
MRVCVIGGGIVGCAVAWELAKQGCQVTVVERLGEVGHGSTAASCGIVRRFYSHRPMIELAHESALIWQDWANYLGPIDDQPASLVQSGVLFIPPAIDETVRASVATMTSLGMDVSILSPDEMADRFGYLEQSTLFPPQSPDDADFDHVSDRLLEGAIFEAEAGYVVSPDLATQNLRRAGERDGVEFLMNCRLLAVSHDARPFVLETSRGQLVADVVVNVAGPHSAQINALVGVTLPLATRALRREVHMLPFPVVDGDLPVVADIDSGSYIKPEARRQGVAIGTTDPAVDALEWVDDPDDYHDVPTQKCRERQCFRAMKRLPELRYGTGKGITALYDVTIPDWYPIVDRTDLPGYYVAIGTSGSSFKTAPLLGLLMARIIEAGEAGHDLDRAPIELSLSRSGRTFSSAFLARWREPLLARGTVMG